jgi:GT2 family glycosyltransferase
MNPPASFPKVFIIVLNFNARETLRDCLGSIFQLDYPNFELVLVDNFSTDGSFELAKNNYSRAHFIQSGQNVGFSAGVNLGIRFALEKMADYIFLLNPDATIEKNALSLLVEAAEKNPKAGLLSPLIFQNETEKIWFAGGKIDWPKMKTIHEQNIPSEKPYPSDFLSGCAMLIKKEVFKKTELFDEDYFLYWEDADFSFRAHRSGFELLVVPEAQVFHFEKSENNPQNKTYWLVFSGLIFFQKNAPFWLRLWLRPYILARKFKNWRDLGKKDHPLAETVKKAYNDYAVWKKKSPKYPS